MPTLNWLTRDEDLRAAGRAAYRLLEEIPALSSGDDAGNILVQGDNLEALKALLPFYAGQVKCIYIDPPFNTKQAFPNYDDNLKHSLWLGMMHSRLEYLRDFLAIDGSIFVHLDDNEIDYAKIMMDEVFQRKNFVSRITLKARSPSAFSTVNPGVFKASEYLLWYCKDKSSMYQDRVWVPCAPDPAYNKYIANIEDTYSQWELEPLAPYLADISRSGKTPQSIQKALIEFVVANAHKIVRLGEIDDKGAGQDIVARKLESIGRPREVLKHLRDGHDDLFIISGQQILFYSKNIKNIDGKLSPARMLTNIWDDIAWEGIAKEGGVKFPRAKKPERLIRRCLQLVTVPGDIVLDSFLGSGTTAAVAHKMNRRYIGVEVGKQAVTHCVPRLRKVIDGEQSGVSKTVDWQGGGGFRFYRLGPPVFDETGRIRQDIAFPLLAAHLWFSETGTPWRAPGAPSPWLGEHDGRGYALLYNGVLRDRSVGGGNVLTRRTVALIREAAGGFNGPLTVYGARSALSSLGRERERVIFKQTPYDVAARA